MRRAFVFAGLMALAMARPELYKEKEDFQFSRSSSDEGTKSGFYGAQRGNMGGNYERAHNMDVLAQHQMGGLVKNVQGELGDGANQKSGSVYTAANSRGMYGSGHYDLSNVGGRNFQEGASFGDSQSQSYRASHNAGYTGQSHSSANSASYGSNSHSGQQQNSRYYSGYNAGDSDQALYSNSNMQNSESLQASKQYEGHRTSENSGYYSQSGSHDRSSYGQTAGQTSNGYGTGSRIRLVNSGPARVYIRPGGTVTVPVAADLYEDSQRSSHVDQNAINTETESLNNNDEHSVHTPTNNGKHYESSYSYRKQWEKHSSNPVGVPLSATTLSPYNSELYEDEKKAQETQSAHSSHRYSGYNTKSASSSHQTSYDSEQQGELSGSASKSSAANSNAYTHGDYNHGHGSSASNYNGVSGSLNNQVEDFGTKPKSYQSSYSYHKSWERQGDPYIITPSTNGQYYNIADGQTSPRLTSSSANQGYGSSDQYYNHGHNSHSSGAAVCCIDNGHMRIARSYNPYEYQQSQNQFESQQVPQNQEYIGQESQNLEDFGKQSQNLEHLGQQSQNLEDFGQQSQKIEDLGPQSQKLEDFGQQSQKTEDLGQQSQNLEDFGQQSQKIEDLGQQSQNLADFGQQSHKNEDLGQQSQNLADFGQQSQNNEDLGQQTQNLNEFSRLSHKINESEQQMDNYEDFGQQSQDAGQLTQNHWDQHRQTDLGQETQNTWSMMETLPNGHQPKDFGEQVIETNNQFVDKQFKPESHTAQDNTFDGNQQRSNAFSSTGSSYYSNHNQHLIPRNDWTEHYNQFDSGFGNNGRHQPFYPMNNNGNYYHHSYESGSSSNSYTNTQYNPWMQGNTYYSQSYNNGYNLHPPTSSSSLSRLWDKLDNLEKHTLSQGESSNVSSSSAWDKHDNVENHNISQEESRNFDSSSLWGKLDTMEKHTLSHETDHFGTNQNKHQNVQNSNFNEQIINNGYHGSTENKLVNLTSPSTTVTHEVSTTTKKPDNSCLYTDCRGDVLENKPRPEEDVGRGDIGPDESSSENLNRPSKPLEIVENKPTKSPEQIESLSLTKATTPISFVQDDNTKFDKDLSVISLSEQKRQEHKIENLHGEVSVMHTTPKIVQPQSPEEIQAHKIDSQFNQGKETQNFDPQNYNQFEDFSQHNVNNQQNVNHQSFEHHSENANQQNEEHKIVDFGQHSANANQELVDFGQHENVNQQNEGHKIVDFGQNSANANKEMVDFGQQNVNQEDFGQQEQTQQESLNDFAVDHGQQEQNQQESLNDFAVNYGQQEQNQQESLKDFQVDQGQQEQTQQEYLNDFAVDHGQQEQTQQESLKDFQVDHGQQEQTQQESLSEFAVDQGQQEQTQQESLKDFQVDQGQQEQTKQESLNDFAVDHGQQEQTQQESLKDFQVDHGQQEQTQQESLSEFAVEQGQQEQTQQESLKDFQVDQGQQEQQLQNWNSQNENMESMENLNQQVQSLDYKQPAQQVETFAPITVNHKEERGPVVEPEVVTKKTTNVEIPPEPTTEKPGFWKRTKDKVSSWFSRS